MDYYVCAEYAKAPPHDRMHRCGLTCPSVAVTDSRRYLLAPQHFGSKCVTCKPTIVVNCVAQADDGENYTYHEFFDSCGF